MDFSDDPTFGGGVDIFFDDTILSFGSFSFDLGWPGDANNNPSDISDGTNGEIFNLGFERSTLLGLVDHLQWVH
jgi:hypothetical protein